MREAGRTTWPPSDQKRRESPIGSPTTSTNSDYGWALIEVLRRFLVAGSAVEAAAPSGG